MRFIKSNALLILVAAVVLIAIVYSLKTAVVLLAGLATALFSDNKSKQVELTAKADLIRKVEEDNHAVIEQLDEIERKREQLEARVVANKEEEIDSWLDR